METWPSGRRHFPAKEAYGLKPVSRVRIPQSPPVFDVRVFDDIVTVAKLVLMRKYGLVSKLQDQLQKITKFS